MDLFYDPADGRCLFTIAGDAPHGLPGARITLPEGNLGQLSSWRVIDGMLVSHDLGPAKEAAILTVNRAAGAARLALMTDIPGQTAIYAAKEAEARAWLAAQPNSLADYPFLAAEVGITAQTPQQLAQLWLNLAGLFRQAGAQSEQARLAAIAAITAATSREEIAGVLATITPS
jgi:hypothetical protein